MKIASSPSCRATTNGKSHCILRKDMSFMASHRPCNFRHGSPGLLLQLRVDLREIVTAGASREPFRGADGPFGKAAPREGFVADGDEVVRGACLQFVNAGDISLALRGDGGIELRRSLAHN